MSTTYRLLGPVEVVRDGTPIELGGPKQRAVLAVLLLEAGRVVSTDRIVDLVWGEEPPPSVTSSLQAFVSNLRRALRDEVSAASPILRRAPGYLVQVDPDDLDSAAFVRLGQDAEAAIREERWSDAATSAQDALSLWRGPLLEEYADEDWARVAAVALADRRLACEQSLAVALLGLGRPQEALRVTSTLVQEQPVDERAAWLHMTTLHQLGRTPDALAVYAEHARLLDEELGLEPGPALRDLQGAVLRQDEGPAAWPHQPGSITPGVVEPPVLAEPVEPPATDGLVGRQRELETLDAGLTGSGDAAGWALVLGPAGIGKSALVATASDRWRGRSRGTVARLSCPEDDGMPPWWPVRQLLRTLGADPDQVLLPPAGHDADSARYVIYERIETVLATAAAERPLLLVVEDVHWADSATLRFLTHLADSPGPAGLGVVVTAREGADQRLVGTVSRRPGARQLSLAPLERREVELLVARVTGAEPEPAELDLMVQRSGGNPFFVTEYARLPADRWGAGEAPVAVRSLLGRRLAGLEPRLLDVLRAAAVVGETVEVDVLAEVTQLDREDLADVLDEAADAQLLVASPRGYEFAHALLREEVASGLGDVRRQRLHLRAAAALAPGTGTERLGRRAAHLLAAQGLADPADVLDACRAAAEDADAGWQSEAAARWWRHALDAFDRLPAGAPDERDRLVLAQVTALARAGGAQSVLDAVDVALVGAVQRKRFDSVGRLATILLRVSGSWPWATYGVAPSAMLERLGSIEPLVASDAAAHARVLAVLGVGSCYDPDPGVRDELTARAIAEAEALGDDAVLAECLFARALLWSGIAERAEESLTLLARRAGLRTADGEVDSLVDQAIEQGLLGMAKATLGDPGSAEHVRRCAAGADLLRLPLLRVQSRFAIGQVLTWTAEHLDEAEAAYRDAWDLHLEAESYRIHGAGERAGKVSGRPGLSVALSCLRWEQGRLDDAPEVADANPRIVPWAAPMIAAARGDADAAELIAAELDRREPPIWTTHGRLTLLAHAVADLGLVDLVDRLRARLSAYSSMIATMGQPGVVSPVSLALARLDLLTGDLEQAAAHLRIAEELAERTGGVGAALRCRLVRAQVARARGDVLDAEEMRLLATAADARGMAGVACDARALIAS